MIKTKFFNADNAWELEGKVNKFIQNKDVINMSYTVAECGFGYFHCCCVLYKE